MRAQTCSLRQGLTSNVEPFPHSEYFQVPMRQYLHQSPKVEIQFSGVVSCFTMVIETIMITWYNICNI